MNPNKERRTYLGRDAISLFSKRNFSHLSPVVLSCLAVLFCVDCARAQNANEGWKIVKQDKNEKTGWALYSRDKAGSKFSEFRVVGTIGSTPQVALKAVRETLTNDKYVGKEEQRTILSNTRDEILMYKLVKMPFPFKDREMCERFIFSENPKTRVFGVTSREAWEKYTPKPDGNRVRMPVTRSVWQFVPVGPGQSRATYDAQFDLGGNLPAGLVNSKAGDGLVILFKSVRALAESLGKYRD